MSRKIIAIIITCVVVLVSVLIEAVPRTSIDTVAGIKLISFPEDNTTFEIKTDANKQFHLREKGETPRYIKSKTNNIFVFNGDFNVAVSAGTNFKIVVLNSDLVHLKLIDGSMAFDHRFTDAPSYVQAANIGVKPEPFSMGYISTQNAVVELHAIQGHLGLDLISGKKSSQYYLVEGNSITFDQKNIPSELFEADYAQLSSFLSQQSGLTPSDLSDIYKLNLDNYLRLNTPLALTYKGQANYLPTKAAEVVIINPVKKNIAALNRLSSDLQTIREALSFGQDADSLIADFNSELDSLLTSERKTILPHLKKWILLYGSLNQDSAYQPIKKLLLQKVALNFDDKDLLSIWTFAVDNQPNWDKLTSYFKIIADDVGKKSTSLNDLEVYKARLFYQLSSYPEKNTVQAHELLKTIDSAMLKRVSDKSNLHSKLILEKVNMIRFIDWLNVNQSFDNKLAASIINMLLQDIETQYPSSSFTESKAEFLDRELPQINETLVRLESI